MSEKLKVVFQILIGEDKMQIGEINCKDLLNYYLTEEELSDSSFQGGYCISVGDVKWNWKEGFYFDLFSYTLNWLRGVEQLLLKESTTADVGFWEESSAKITLVTYDTLEIVDIWHKDIMAKPILVNFEDFCVKLLFASRQYEQLAIAIKNILEAPSSKIDKKLSRYIIQEMCSEDFRIYNDSIDHLISKYFIQ